MSRVNRYSCLFVSGIILLSVIDKIVVWVVNVFNSFILIPMVVVLVLYLTSLLYGVYNKIKYYYFNNGFQIDEAMTVVEGGLSPRQFEIFCAELFRALGHRVELTEATNDYGRDIIVDGDIFVECKHYSEHNFVGREICQKLLGSIQMFGAESGIIVTTGRFHNNAYECYRMVDNLDLWDSRDIKEKLQELDIQTVKRIIYRASHSA